MEIPIKINSLNGLIVDFGDYDVNQTVEAVKEFYLSNFVTNNKYKFIKHNKTCFNFILYYFYNDITQHNTTQHKQIHNKNNIIINENN